jgi:hypothetical protein
MLRQIAWMLILAVCAVACLGYLYLGALVVEWARYYWVLQ